MLKAWQDSSLALVIYIVRLSYNKRNLSAPTLPILIKKRIVRLYIIFLVTILSIKLAFTYIYSANPDLESIGLLLYIADPAFWESA